MIQRYDMHVLVIAVIFLAATFLPATRGVAQKPDEYLSAAQATAAWMDAHRVDTEAGVGWPVAPAVSDQRSAALYHGSAGGALFYLALYQAASEAAGSESADAKKYQDEALRAADELIAGLPDDSERDVDCGLYTGVAGIGFVLQQFAEVTQETKYRQAATKCLEIVKSRAREQQGGVAWNNSTDIISGTAGIGLYLLDAADALEDAEAMELATAAGDALLSAAETTPSGMSWRMNPTYPRDMPNFSHGTAGIAYFLCRLGVASEESRFVDVSIAGANHLVAIAQNNDDGLCVYHHAPDGEDLFYLGWCHGPPGTARLFIVLAQATGDDAWHEFVHAAAKSVLSSGAPDQRTPGFWNNEGMCCGTAGVAEFFLELSVAYDREDYRDFAVTAAKSLIGQAITARNGDGTTMSWEFAEHRVQPDNTSAQTGYMQGAAGIGILLIRMDAFTEGRAQPARLPDSPFGS